MKLLELDSKSKAQQNKRVFESQFGQKLSVERLTVKEAKKMLNRVRRTISEHRATAAFHRSERNPAYLKLMVMEQALAARIAEAVPMGTTGSAAVAPGATANATGSQDPAAAAKLRATTQLRRKEIQTQIKQKQQEIAALQKQMNSPTLGLAETRLQRKLMEAEVQQAQVVLAAQDMVDRVQKMLEEVTAMQFKDLPALVDSIRNEVGMDQAQQFNGEATAALGALVQNLQGSKTQLESAQGILTGQAPVVPGDDLGGAEMGAELPPPEGEEVDVDIDADVELPGADDEEDELMNLGRGRR